VSAPAPPLIRSSNPEPTIRSMPERVSPLCIAAEAHAAIIGDNHCRGGKGVIRRIEPCAADKLIASQPAAQHIVTHAAVETVGEIIAGQRIVEPGTGQAFDIGEHIALRIAARASGAIQRHLHGRGRGGIIRDIVADAAVEQVRAATAGEDIIPAPPERMFAPASPVKASL
jgi:hypothetical protein